MLKKDLIKYDPTKIHETYDQWPQIAKAAYQNENCTQYDFKNIDKVLFAGMGGSGTVGDLISSIMNKNINSLVIKNNRIRQSVNEHTLVVITSISGDTKESLDILKEALEKNFTNQQWKLLSYPRIKALPTLQDTDWNGTILLIKDRDHSTKLKTI